MDLPRLPRIVYARSQFSHDYPEPFKAVIDLHPGDAWQFIYGRQSGTYNLNMAPGSGSDMERITGEKVLLRVFGENFATARFVVIHPAAAHQGDEPPEVPDREPANEFGGPFESWSVETIYPGDAEAHELDDLVVLVPTINRTWTDRRTKITNQACCAVCGSHHWHRAAYNKAKEAVGPDGMGWLPSHTVCRNCGHSAAEHAGCHPVLMIGQPANPLEAAIADIWAEDNTRQPGLNGGHGTLQDLMIQEVNAAAKDGQCIGEPWLTERDRRVAALAIQWTMTNCGRDMYERAAKRGGSPITWKL